MSIQIATGRPLRILCFDLENKPGTYGPGDFTHGKVTALAAQFLTESEPVCWALRRARPKEMRRQALAFAKLWEQSDVVMGHYIRRHDIKLLQGMMDMLALPRLPDRRVIDTCVDMAKSAGYSKSLENQCARWGCPWEKVNMTEYDWEQAYDGIPWAVEKMKRRCTTDVRMNVWLYGEQRRRGLLVLR